VLFRSPLINLVDVPGFLPGTDQEYRGLIRHGAKILFAYGEATVPKITLILRKAYGGAYIALCSRDMGYDRILAYPTAQIAVMGPEGAVDILYRREIAKAADAEEERQARITSYTKQFATPYAAAALGLVDEVIDPARTREALLRALHMTSTKRKDCVARKHGNLPL
jgi:methylmalonyl-CoA decarboxylase subunit alpha